PVHRLPLSFFLCKPPPTQIYTLSLHDALPIFLQGIGASMMTPIARLVLLRSTPRNQLVAAMSWLSVPALIGPLTGPPLGGFLTTDRKSTRLNSSHVKISYAVFCLKKKKIDNIA